jgi:arylformamidase
MMAACDWQNAEAGLPAGLVPKALPISGLFDLEPMMHTPFLKDSLRLTPADVLRASPAFLRAPRAAKVYAVAGGAESEEFARQNSLIRSAWGSRVVPVCEMLPGLNHFSIVEALAQPGHRLHALALELLAD